MANAPIPKWIVPGKQWRGQVSACRLEIIRKIALSQPLLISKLLAMLPLNPIDPQTLDDLVARGSLEFANGKVSNNATDITRAAFLDDNVGSIRLVVPTNVVATVTTDQTAVEFKAETGDILIILGDLPAQYPFSGNFVLRGLSLAPEATSYTLQDQVTPNGWFEIVVDFTAAATPLASLAALRAMPTHRRQKFELAMRLMTSSSDPCSTSPDPWYIFRRVGGMCYMAQNREDDSDVAIYGPAGPDETSETLETYRKNGTCK